VKATDAMPSDGISSQFQPDAVRQASELFTIMNAHKLLHMYFILASYLLNAGVVPGGVLTDIASMLTEKICESLEKEFSLPSSAFTVRKKQFVVTTARNIAIYHACFRLVATEEGRLFLDRNRCRPTDWVAFRDFVFKGVRLPLPASASLTS
jgi:hypothetical protein